MIEIKCIKCNKILTGHYKRLDTPKLCKDCRSILITLPCSVCGKISKVYRLEQYYSNTYENHYCSQSCVMKAVHKNDSYKYCEVCKDNTKHIIGIGCMSCYNKSDSHKASIVRRIKERYGEEYTNVYQVPEIKEKIVRTSLERYNTTNPGNNREARIKANYTMRNNGNGSSCEDIFEQYLIDNKINYKKQYKSEKYPFLCDFYLVDSDLYIELNIYWSHNDHYFDNSNKDDIKTLELWKQKAKEGHKQYQNAINVWTNKDLQKRQTAIYNNLNYVVLWTVEEIKEFFYINQEIETQA